MDFFDSRNVSAKELQRINGLINWVWKSANCGKNATIVEIRWSTQEFFRLDCCFLMRLMKLINIADSTTPSFSTNTEKKCLSQWGLKWNSIQKWSKLPRDLSVATNSFKRWLRIFVESELAANLKSRIFHDK